MKPMNTEGRFDLEYLTSLGQHRIRLGLHRMRRALEDLERPDLRLRILLVAGTNGKGSTCAMAAAVLRPHVLAMTRIALDHREYFGSSLAEVALAEASILKPNVPVAVSPGQPPEAMEVLRAEAARIGASLWPCSDEYVGQLSLRGAHQRKNAALAKAALEILTSRGLPVPSDAVARGFASARWPGRLEEIDGVLLDVAHNPDGAEILATALRELYPGRPVEFVFGVMAGKDFPAILRALVGVARRLHLCPPPYRPVARTGPVRCLSSGAWPVDLVVLELRRCPTGGARGSGRTRSGLRDGVLQHRR